MLAFPDRWSRITSSVNGRYRRASLASCQLCPGQPIQLRGPARAAILLPPLRIDVLPADEQRPEQRHPLCGQVRRSDRWCRARWQGRKLLADAGRQPLDLGAERQLEADPSQLTGAATLARSSLTIGDHHVPIEQAAVRELQRWWRV
jgi:hypothetical protein